MQLDHIFANVDKTQVPSAYLEESAEQLLGLRHYNGVLTDSNRTDVEVLRYLRATIQSARVRGTDTLPGVVELNRRLRALGQGLAGAPNPIAVQWMTYHRIRPDALEKNLLSVQNNQVFDVPGRSENPYQSQTLFAAAPLYPVSRTRAVSFLFRRNLYLTNNPTTTVVGLEIDFEDGRGYVPATWGQPVGATYTSDGHKHIRVRLTYRVSGQVSTTSTSTTTPRTGPATQAAPSPTTTFSLASHFDLEVLPQPPAARYGPTDNIFWDMPATGAHSGARVSVRFGQGHTAMTKPFIIVEQYNLASILEDKAPELIPCDNGNNTIVSFLERINQPVLASYNSSFENVLQNIGQYDIVYIDFKRNTDDIRRNAVLFQEVVRWVNALKAQAGSTQQNVVMGQSMGGLVSRYGLAQLTRLPADPDPATGRNRNNPETRLLVLHDSPQRGAYSPVGTSSLTRALDVPGLPFGYSIRDFSSTADAAVTILDEPASQQLSILNAYNPRGDIRPDPFLNGQYRQVITFDPAESQQPGYTIIATSDGSQCGRGQNTPTRVTIAQTTGDFFLRPLSYLPYPLNILSDFNLKANGAAYGLPPLGQQATVSRLRVYAQYNLCIPRRGPFRVCIPLFNANFINETATSPPNTLPYETLPGGTTNPADNAACSPPLNNYVVFLYRVYLRTNLYNGDLCFVPTYSALDVPVASTATAYAKYINNATDSPSPPNVLRYIAQENVNGSGTLFNLPHLRFTARNSEWIFNEMQRPFAPAGTNPNPVACEPNPECNPITVTTGAYNGSVCPGTNITFTVNNVPGNATVTWTAQGGTVSTGTGFTFVTSPDGIGDRVVAEATILTAGGCTFRRISSVLSGPPAQSLEPICGYYSSAGGGGGFSIPPVPGATSYRWTEHNDNMGGSLPPFTSAFPSYFLRSITPPNYGVTITLTVEPINDCGIGPSTTDILEIDGNGYGYLCRPFGRSGAKAAGPTAALYPNPARETVAVRVDNATPTAPVTVRLFDGHGQPRAEQTSTGATSLQFSTAQLPAGLYFVHILRGRQVLSRQQLRVEK